jgi:tetratricopeptide (TPR) repeat protein
MENSTIISIGFIPLSIYLIWIIFYWVDISSTPEKGNIFIIQSIPNTLITCGVLGTFLGIAIGLQYFDLDDIDNSIEDLLNGLKSAFWSSIVGISLSIFASNYIKSFLMKHGAKMDVPQSEETKATLALQEEIKTQHLATQKIQQEGFDGLTESLGSFASTIKDSNSDTMQGLIEGLNTKTDEIVDTMKANSVLMVEKFDEFSKLLARANVEALKTAFEQLITDFNRTFQDLISSLVDQNFKELTDSVKHLNAWQEQNRKDVERLYAIIESLLNQSTKLVGTVETSAENILEDLEASASSLNGITQNTNKLVNDDGELVTILNALKQVMIDDSKFIEITSNLSLASDELSSTSKKLGIATVSLDETTTSLKEINEWHQQLSNSTQMIIKALLTTQKNFDVIENKLGLIAGHTDDLVNGESRLVAIVNDLDSIANDEENNFKAITDNLFQAVSEFEEEKRLISTWLNREDGIHSAMMLYTEGIKQFTEALEHFEKAKNYDLNVFNKTFERNLETGLLSTFNQLDRLLKEYVHFLETDNAKRIVQIEFTSKNK